MYAKMSNYVKHFSYAPLPDDYFLKYKAMSDARKFETDTETDKHSTQLEKKKAALKALMLYMKQEHNISAVKMSEITSGAVSHSHISEQLKNSPQLSSASKS